MSKKFYVIWKGAQTGIFSTWPEVQQHTAGRSDAQYMGFESKSAAEQAFASSYTKALMQRSLSKGGSASTSPTSSRKAPSKTSSKSASAKTATISPNGPSDIEIYCDGACSPNPGKSGTGIAVYQLGKVTSLYYGLYLPNGTNNTAELSGLLSAFQIAQHFIEKDSEQSICILSDSKYSIDSITKWASGWQKTGWTRGKGEEIKNLEIIQECFSLYQQFKSQIIINHVKGHANIEGNELSDRMAVLARMNKETSFVQYTENIDVTTILAMPSG